MGCCAFERARQCETVCRVPCGCWPAAPSDVCPALPVLRSGALEFLHTQWWFGACAHVVFGHTGGELDEHQPTAFTGVRVPRNDVNDCEVGDDALDDGLPGIRQ